MIFKNTGIIHRSRYLFYSSIGLISFIIRKFIFSFYHKYNKYKINHKCVAVCGRGLSANKYFNDEYYIHSKLFIANYTDKDLTIKDYQKLVNKELVIVSNIVEVMPSILRLFFIKISEIIIAQPNSRLKRGFNKSKRASYRLNLLGVKVRGIEISKYMNIYGSNKNVNKIGTGIYAIYEAAEFAMRHHINNIHLYGFDFYSGPKNKLSNLRDDFIADEHYLMHREDYIHLSECLDYLVKNYPKITFINNTFNSYEFKSQNIKSILPLFQ